MHTKIHRPATPVYTQSMCCVALFRTNRKNKNSDEIRREPMKYGDYESNKIDGVAMFAIKGYIKGANCSIDCHSQNIFNVIPNG